MKAKPIRIGMVVIATVVAITAGLTQPASAAAGGWNLGNSGCILRMTATNSYKYGAKYPAADLNASLSQSTGPCGRYRLYFMAMKDKSQGKTDVWTYSNTPLNATSASLWINIYNFPEWTGTWGYYLDGYAEVRDSVKRECYRYWLHPGATVLSKSYTFAC